LCETWTHQKSALGGGKKKRKKEKGNRKKEKNEDKAGSWLIGLEAVE
jgi:hypothetical protein